MPKLFVKVFLSFWLLVALFSATTFLAMSEQIDRRRARLREASPLGHIVESVAAAQAAADRGGRPALEEWLRETNDIQPVPAFLVDTEGRELLGRDLPDYLNIVHGRIKLIGAGPVPLRAFHARGPGLFTVSPGGPMPPVMSGPPTVMLDDGTEYLFVPDFGGVTIWGLIAANATLVLSWLLAMLLLSGLVCFGLARHVTRPLIDLRTTARRWGGGRLKERSPAAIRARNDELADLARELDNMAARLQSLLDGQQQLLSDVSHEMRSPLTRLVMAAALLRRLFAGERLPELDRIEHEAGLLGSNIERVLFAARLDAENVPASRASVDVAALARKSADAAALVYPDAGATLVWRGVPQAVVRGDPGLLRIALDNVLLNAMKYGRGGGVEVEVIRREGPAPGVSIHVRDEGPGVPQAMLQQIFERFVRVDPARQASTGGLGLGLAIAKRAVHLHDGTIVAQNRHPHGLEVIISLPGAK